MTSFDIRAVNLKALNSLTKYPSIPTYHKLDPRNGSLTDEAVPFTGPVIGTEKIDRSPLLRKTFAELLRSVPEVRAVAVADAELFEKHFQIPRISRRPAEVSALREVVRANTYYVYELRVGSPPR